MNITELAIYKKMFGGGTSGATAYTVSSVDELPSNAVDGSMAIIEKKMTHFVIFKDTIEIPTTWIDSYQYLTFGASSSDTGSRLWWFNEIYFFDGGLSFENQFTGQLLDEAYLEGEGWKTKSIYYNAREGMFSEVWDWLRQNAESYGSLDETIGCSYLFTHENGQWVYKCEVV